MNSVKKFEVINQNAGLNLSKITVNRDSFKKYEDENLYQLSVREMKFESAGYENQSYDFRPTGKYPANFFNIAPELRTQIGGPDGFFLGDLSLSLYSETKLSRSLAISGHGSIGLIDTFDDLKLTSDSVLPHVRTDIVKYLKESNDYNIKRLQIDYFMQLDKDIYAKLTGGILESMFAGIGGEILFRPFHRNFAIGAEAWRVKQREYNMLFRFLDYETTTGHVNFYYREPRSQILFTIRGGRFLAKDSGFNFDFSIALTINSSASSLVLIDGAKPPSSPTLVSIFFDFNKLFKFWITRKHFSTASIKFFAESGLIINS